MGRRTGVLARTSIALVVVAGALVPASPAYAATRTWDGEGDPNLGWSNAANWDGAIANDDALAFPAGVSVPRQKTSFDIASFEADSLAFGGATVYTVAGTSGDHVLEVGPGGIDSGGDTDFLSVVLRLAAGQTWESGAGGRLVTDGPVDVGEHTLTVVTTGDSRQSFGALMGSGQVLKQGGAASTLQLPAPAGGFAGELVVDEGTVELGPSSNALGSALVDVLAGGAVELGDGDLSVPNFLTLRGEGPGAGGALIGSSGIDTWTGPVTLAAPTAVAAAAGARLNLNGVIGGSGAATLAKLGDGIVALNADNIYPGGTRLNGGTLLVNGDNGLSDVTVDAGTLGGTGETGAITANGGAVAPGASTGVLRSGSVLLKSGSQLAVELDDTPGTGHDQLAVAGTVTLEDATLTGTQTGSETGDTYRIVDNDGTDAVVGTFEGLAEGATATIGGRPMTISYTGGDGNDVVLTDAGVAENTAPVFSADSACGKTVMVQARPGGALYLPPDVVTVTATDAEGQTITLAVTGLPAWITQQVSNGNPAVATLSMAPTLLDLIGALVFGTPDSATPKVTATDDHPSPASAECQLTAMISGADTPIPIPSFPPIPIPTPTPSS